MTHLVGAALAGLVLATVVPTSIDAEAEAARAVAPLPVPRGLQDGDLVFRRGIDAIGRIVLDYGDRPRFSHVGMVVEVDGQPRVIHALPTMPGHAGGVQIEPLGAFASPLRASDVGFYRASGLTPVQRATIRDFLFAHVGAPFDLRFAYSSDDAMYCTELVIKALAAAGVDLASQLHAVHVITVDEPTYPPDSLRQAGRLRELAAGNR